MMSSLKNGFNPNPNFDAELLPSLLVKEMLILL